MSFPDYRAPRWLAGAHAQTIWPRFNPGPLPVYRRERWDTPDGDFIDLDWIDGPPGAPLLVLFHGLEGSSRSHYARAIMRAVRARRWGGVVPHFRGCSGEPNLLPRAYHSGDSDEIDWVLRRLHALHPQRALYAVGISLGGNALAKWAGEHGDDAGRVAHAIAAVCAPLDLAVAGRTLERGFNRVYTEYFLRTLRPGALEKLARFPGIADRERILRARTLHEFDDAVTAPLHGFRSADDYWQRASSKPHLHGIGVPALLLNAQNDPFLPGHALPGPHETSSYVVREFPQHGGHVGFVSGPIPGHTDWLPARLIAFFESL
ncbi:MAG TPA: hydrolase [Rhodocyclaceae bacterium]|nr:hydrolase [Rhodocyclaceae bacterium]HMV55116.1 hydrolase [Rhodocyclaceae bacterium]HMZ83493.1 hydrolase [Rhodocyclaceae bacterium]HNA03327.1 hydrolase [Rhodocyclaceae bacterium]HNB77038.1 hydrolase [Rhodocyclaceae bacterium]